MANYDEIKVFVETHYDLAVESVTPITHKSMKVRASNHDYLLKVASGDDDFIMKQLLLIKHYPVMFYPFIEQKITNTMFHGEIISFI